jgi:hypothetical protein
VTPSQADITDLRMVIVAAQPAELPSLKLDVEVGNIHQAIRDFDVEGVRISAIPCIDATPSDLVQTLAGAGSAYILHFAGHGAVEVRPDWLNPGAEKQEGSILLLADKASRAEARLPADDFARLLQRAGVRLAVIGACHSGWRDSRYPWDSIASALTARLIPAVVAMQYEVIDQSAVDFSRMFYYALASGLSLDEAVALGRQAMLRANSAGDPIADVEWGVPVLYTRLASGSIFPERMARAGAAAEALSSMVEQTIGSIKATGKVTGISLERLEGGSYRVKQRVHSVEGELTGIKTTAGEGDLDVDQHLDVVSGDVTGIELKGF